MPRPAGRHAVCLTFSNGLTCTASHAGCKRREDGDGDAAAERQQELAEREICRPPRSMSENKLPTVSPTATSAARANSQPSKAPMTEPASASSKRFGDDQAEQLAALHPQAAQRANFFSALDDRNRNRVVNQKKSDEERDQTDEEKPDAKRCQQLLDLLAALARALDFAAP